MLWVSKNGGISSLSCANGTSTVHVHVSMPTTERTSHGKLGGQKITGKEKKGRKCLPHSQRCVQAAIHAQQGLKPRTRFVFNMNLFHPSPSPCQPNPDAFVGVFACTGTWATVPQIQGMDKMTTSCALAMRRNPRLLPWHFNHLASSW